MRNALELKNISIPQSEKSLNWTSAQKQLQEWQQSNFAGYRRLVDAGSDCYPDLKEIKKIANDHTKGATGKSIKHFVVMGTGGSSLGGETLIRALHAPGKNPQFYFADNNDPQYFHDLLASLSPEETLFYAVSKSGTTPETISQLLVALAWIKASLKDNWKKHFVFCTDPQKGDLRKLSETWGIDCLPVPSPVGGRFSVLSAVGLFPAAFAGLDLEGFLAGAQSIAKFENSSWEKNPCALLAKNLVTGQKERPITVLMPYSSQLSAFSRWFCQLWAESLGKEGQGFTPYPAIGTTDQHSQVQLYMEGPKDKVIVLLHVKKFTQSLPLHFPEGTADLPAFQELKGRSMLDLFDAEFRATRDAFTNNGVANCTLEIDQLDEYSLGALFYFWESTTAIAGALAGINPFDQPGVEAAKVLTKKYLRELGK